MASDPIETRNASAPLLVHAFSADEWRLYRDLRLRALEDAPDAFGSTLEAERGRSDEAWRERVASGAASPDQLPLVARLGDTAVGLAWGWYDPSGSGKAGVSQMWVAPEGRGRRVGAALLSEIVRWARSRGARSVELRVTRGNDAAERIYRSAGFVPYGAEEPLRPGSARLSRRMRLEIGPGPRSGPRSGTPALRNAPGGPITWRVHLAASPGAVFEALDSDVGRASFWAESAVEADGWIDFRFINGVTHRARILRREPGRMWSIEYFGGQATFELGPDGEGGTDLVLTHDGVPHEDWHEVHAGWLNVLFPLKAWVDHGVDLRNHDPKRTWDLGYVDQ